MLHSYSITVSGLLAQGNAIAAHATNIANMNSVEADGTNYAPVDQVTISQEAGGVTSATVESPGSSLEDEVVGLLAAKTSYTANAKLIGIQRDMDKELLDILT